MTSKSEVMTTQGLAKITAKWQDLSMRTSALPAPLVCLREKGGIVKLAIVHYAMSDAMASYNFWTVVNVLKW